MIWPCTAEKHCRENHGSKSAKQTDDSRSPLNTNIAFSEHDFSTVSLDCSPMNIDAEIIDAQEAIRTEWCAETSWDPTDWSSSVRSAGQCFSSSYVIRTSFGGEILYAELMPHTESLQRHAWNRLPTGVEIDLTRDQFSSGQEFKHCELPLSRIWAVAGPQAELLLARLQKRLSINGAGEIAISLASNTYIA